MKQKNKKSVPFNVLKKGMLGMFLITGCAGIFAGCDGKQPLSGKSAYEIAVENGYQGTEAEWLQSLKAQTPSVSISDDGYWVINGTKTQVIAQGTSGSNGNKWSIGNGAPSAQAAQNDMYLDRNTYNIYIMDQGNWSLLGSIKGDSSVGQPGEDGNVWIVGEGAPSQTANIGDMYYDSTNNVIYQYKAGTPEAYWDDISSINGKDGSNWLFGATAPAAQDGKVGDMYYNTATSDIYKKTASGWGSPIGNAKGQNGNVWLVGQGAPANELGGVGDMYYDKTTNQIYQKGTSAWASVSNINGANIADVSVVSDKWGINTTYTFTLNDADETQFTSTTKTIIPGMYYGASSQQDIQDLLAEGVTYIKLLQDINVTQQIIPAASLSFDLNGKALNYSAAQRFEINQVSQNPIEVQFKNGAMNFTNAGSSATIAIDSACAVRLENVTYTSNTTALFPKGDAARVDIINSTVISNVYAVATNASIDKVTNKPKYSADNNQDGIKININNSTLLTNSDDNDNTAVLMNVPGVLTINKSELTGQRQAVIVRGAEVSITDSKLVCSASYDGADAFSYTTGYSMAENWKDGNRVPMGALILGDCSNSEYAYQFPTDCKLINSQLISKKSHTSKLIAVPIEKEGKGINLVYEGEFSALEAKELESVVCANFFTTQFKTGTLNSLVNLANTFGRYLGYPDSPIVLSLTQDVMEYQESVPASQITKLEQLNSFISNIDEYQIYGHAERVLVNNENELVYMLQNMHLGPISFDFLVLQQNMSVADMYQQQIDSYIQSVQYGYGIIAGEYSINYLTTRYASSVEQLQQIYDEVGQGGGEPNFRVVLVGDILFNTANPSEELLFGLCQQGIEEGVIYTTQGSIKVIMHASSEDELMDALVYYLTSDDVAQIVLDTNIVVTDASFYAYCQQAIAEGVIICGQYTVTLQ